jgi:radical SAM protein with 4Fe4S-binding SPASM domain
MLNIPDKFGIMMHRATAHQGEDHYMQVSIGIGLTNACNLACAHCYRPQDRIYQLGLDEVRRICERLEVASFNMGTGESWLHPEFPEIVAYLSERGIKMSMASNGYSLGEMPLSLLSQFHDVEVSVDFGSARGQDAFRGPGNWDCVMAAIERCRAAGLEVTLLATLMNINVKEMDKLVGVARDVGANLRVNVYQPVQHDEFMLSYAQFWEGFRRLLAAGRLLSTSEPIVNAMLDLDSLVGSPCGRHSIRFTPQGTITPCVYWPQSPLALSSLDALTAEGILASETFQQARAVPDACRDCPHVASCGGGCASRRALLGDLNQPDLYCPLVRGQTVDLSFAPAPQKDLPRGGNVCTTIIVP